MAFFGLPPDYSSYLHTQIFEICYYGNGFTFADVYNMPTHLRKFYYSKLADAKEKEKEASKGNSPNSSPPPRGPAVSPSHSGKVRMG